MKLPIMMMRQCCCSAMVCYTTDTCSVGYGESSPPVVTEHVQIDCRGREERTWKLTDCVAAIDGFTKNRSLYIHCKTLLAYEYTAATYLLVQLNKHNNPQTSTTTLTQHHTCTHQHLHQHHRTPLNTTVQTGHHLKH